MNELDGNSAAAPEFKDRKVGLVLFGIVEILLGIVCAFLVPLMLVAMIVAATAGDKGSAPPMSPASMIPGLLFYALLAVWFVWMGIGSILARRWARALLLVSSWIWLIGGIMGLISMLVFFPAMSDQINQAGQTPKEVATVIKVVLFGFMTVFFVLIPGALVLFYSSRHVKATCERRDLRIRWTDLCPLPVLAVSVMAVGWALCMPFMGVYGWAVPFFGCILNGMAGAGVTLAATALLGYVAWGAYRLRIQAWWCAAGLIAAWGVSAGITFSRMDLMAFYEKMNLPPQQLELIRQTALPQTHWMVIFGGLWVVLALAYLLQVKRFFAPPGTK